jgi:hypothetical protein
MLAEIQDVRQNPGEGYRRWFRDDKFDLIVFYPSEGSAEISGFQLCYGRENGERVLTWLKSRGYRHNRIDDGEIPYHNKMSPILVKDGVFDPDSVLEEFLEVSEGVDDEIIEVVEDRIKKLQFAVE